MILKGDCIERLRELPEQSVHTCVTSPPYFGLRDYGMDGQIGLEETPEAFVARLVEVFREVKRVLRDDGTLWLNLGDSYANDGKWGGSSGGKHVKTLHGNTGIGRMKTNTGLKPKDLVGIPWRVAFALQADGWYLRSDIIWSKPNPMPESVTDRPTKAHEYLFLLSKRDRYYYDHEAIKEPMALSSIDRLAQDVENQTGSERANGNTRTDRPMKAVGRHLPGNKTHKGATAYEQGSKEHRTKAGLVAYSEKMRELNESDSLPDLRNKRTVWTVATMPFKEAHFATFPPKLIEPCVLAGAPVGGTVLDPFFGAGTTGLVALENGREYIGIELNPTYIEIAKRRLSTVQPKMMI